jgi:hypothetical protein
VGELDPKCKPNQEAYPPPSKKHISQANPANKKSSNKLIKEAICSPIFQAKLVKKQANKESNINKPIEEQYISPKQINKESNISPPNKSIKGATYLPYNPKSRADTNRRSNISPPKSKIKS